MTCEKARKASIGKGEARKNRRREWKKNGRKEKGKERGGEGIEGLNLGVPEHEHHLLVQEGYVYKERKEEKQETLPSREFMRL